MALLVIINCWRSARRLQFCVIRANWRGRVPYQEVVGGRGTVVDTSCKKMQRLQDRAASRLYRAWLPQRTWWPMGDFITLLHGWLPSSCFQGQSEAKRQEKDDSVKNNSRVWEAWWSVACNEIRRLSFWYFKAVTNVSLLLRRPDLLFGKDRGGSGWVRLFGRVPWFPRITTPSICMISSFLYSSSSQITISSFQKLFIK